MTFKADQPDFFRRRTVTFGFAEDVNFAPLAAGGASDLDLHSSRDSFSLLTGARRAAAPRMPRVDADVFAVEVN